MDRQIDLHVFHPILSLGLGWELDFALRFCEVKRGALKEVQREDRNILEVKYLLSSPASFWQVQTLREAEGEAAGEIKKSRPNMSH